MRHPLCRCCTCSQNGWHAAVFLRADAVGCVTELSLSRDGFSAKGAFLFTIKPFRCPGLKPMRGPLSRHRTRGRRYRRCLRSEATAEDGQRDAGYPNPTPVPPRSRVKSVDASAAAPAAAARRSPTALEHERLLGLARRAGWRHARAPQRGLLASRQPPRCLGRRPLLIMGHRAAPQQRRRARHRAGAQVRRRRVGPPFRNLDAHAIAQPQRFAAGDARMRSQTATLTGSRGHMQTENA